MLGLGHAGSPYRYLEQLGHIVGQVDADLGLHGRPPVQERIHVKTRTTKRPQWPQRIACAQRSVVCS